MRSATPTLPEFDELLAYLPVFSARGFRPIRRWIGGNRNKTDGGTMIMPWPEYDEAVIRFFSAAARDCWSDHNYASKRMDEAIRDPRMVACATMQEIKSMLTWCVRRERFCDGHWATAIEDGYINNILQRLQALRPR